MKCIYAHGSKVKKTNRKCSIHISNSKISVQNQFLNTHEGLVGPGKDSRQSFFRATAEYQGDINGRPCIGPPNSPLVATRCTISARDSLTCSEHQFVRKDLA